MRLQDVWSCPILKWISFELLRLVLVWTIALPDVCKLRMLSLHCRFQSRVGLVLSHGALGVSSHLHQLNLGEPLLILFFPDPACWMLSQRAISSALRCCIEALMAHSNRVFRMRGQAIDSIETTTNTFLEDRLVRFFKPAMVLNAILLEVNLVRIFNY